VKGKVHVDAGCAGAILEKKNVYAAGITSCEGIFGHMDAISILSGGIEIARGLINYSADVRIRTPYVPVSNIWHYSCAWQNLGFGGSLRPKKLIKVFKHLSVTRKRFYTLSVCQGRAVEGRERTGSHSRNRKLSSLAVPAVTVWMHCNCFSPEALTCQCTSTKHLHISLLPTYPEP
jgi:hypothetical protein